VPHKPVANHNDEYSLFSSDPFAINTDNNA